MALVIRECQKRDLPNLVGAEQECFIDPWTETMLKSEMERKDFYGLVAEADGVFIGYGFLSVLFENADLERIALLPDYRGKGYGGKLLDELLSGAKTRGAEQMFLEVRCSNETALRLYESRGFERTRIRKGYYNGEDAVEMKKTLL